MRKVERSEIKDLVAYEKAREAMRARVIEVKKHRRVAVGPNLTLLFENRDTVLFQIQEMCRAERIVDDARIAEEVEVYNALLPGPGELSATMMIEIEERDQIQLVLDRLLGIDTRDYVRMEVGGVVVPGHFEVGHSDEERGKISAVHFVRFPLLAEARQAFRMAGVWLVVDHPNERARAQLSDETRAALADDL